jgi:dihydrodipicolinate synthase/N-acetylneuraminate lyase
MKDVKVCLFVCLFFFFVVLTIVVDIYNLSVWAKKKGCNAVMVLPPHYYPQHQSEKVVTAFFKRVADSSPLPVIIYS